MAEKKYNSFYVRLVVLLLFFLLFLLAIAWSLHKVMFVEGDFWISYAKVKNDTVDVNAPRGNIYDCNRNLLVSTLPVYRVQVDFDADRIRKYESEFRHDLDSICISLSSLLNISKAELKSRIQREMSRPSGQRNRNYKIVGNAEYDLPTINALRNSKYALKYKCFSLDKRLKREKPFGLLGSRTLGDVYKDVQVGGKSGKCGLESYYDKDLKGESGLARKQMIRGKKYLVNMIDAEDGSDLVTTFDVRMMDIVESELKAEMNNSNADHGCAVLMDVKTGEVKAMSNLKMNSDREFYEEANYAVNSMTEPGSTFKVASVVALLESGKVDTSYKIDTGDGKWQLSNWPRPMKDHNWEKGGYGEISLAQAVWYSSNIGISKPAMEVFGLSRDSSKKFVDRLYSMKLNEKLNIEIPGVGIPKIPHPTDKGVDWAGTSLPWMSIGYGVQVPPIYTLTFYNGLANNGKMIKPIFVKSIERNGKVMLSNSTEVLNPKLCSTTTLNKVKDMLRGVVLYGTGKAANSKILQVAGKSGTSQMYAGEVLKGYQVSFCGYFPADEPKYSCIVVMWQEGSWHSQNHTAAVFGKIAERVYALGEREISRPDEDSRVRPYLAKVKNGKTKEVDYLLDKLDLKTKSNKVDSEWSVVENRDSIEVINSMNNKLSVVPSVIGWGAKDAIFLLENRGLKVEIQGRGKVVQQSISPGTTVVKGGVIRIVLKS